MTLGIVVLDMRKLGGIFESWDGPVEVTEPFVRVGVVGADGAEVGLDLYVSIVSRELRRWSVLRREAGGDTLKCCT